MRAQRVEYVLDKPKCNLSLCEGAKIGMLGYIIRNNSEEKFIQPPRHVT